MAFLLFYLHRHHHHISIVFAPPPPSRIYCFPSSTTTNPFLFNFPHHHNSIVFHPLPPPPLHLYCFPSSTTTTITFLLFSLLHHHQPFSYLTSTNINTTFLLLYHHHHQIDCLKRRSNRPKPGPKSPIQAKIAKIRPKEEKELRAIYITCLFGGGGGKTINTFLILYSST